MVAVGLPRDLTATRPGAESLTRRSTRSSILRTQQVGVARTVELGPEARACMDRSSVWAVTPLGGADPCSPTSNHYLTASGRGV